MSKVYEIITERIINMLDAGTVPWRKPWAGDDAAPKSMQTGKPYRGVNAFLLAVIGMERGYTSSQWVTYKQAQERGGKVRKGEKGSPVVFWKRLDVEDKQTGDKRQIPFLRYFTVFNAEQCDGVEYDKAVFPLSEFQKIERAQALVDGMPQRPELKVGGFKACYQPAFDTVWLPEPRAFKTEAEFYSTAFHELGHSTGHHSRLARKKDLKAWAGFGSHEYSQEELVAEMTAAFLCGHCGIEAATIENSASYIDHWRRVLKADNKCVVVAAAQAQKAADFILAHQMAEVEV
jgi:antirestriction protein ArdC